MPRFEPWMAGKSCVVALTPCPMGPTTTGTVVGSAPVPLFIDVRLDSPLECPCGCGYTTERVGAFEERVAVIWPS